MYIFIVSYNGSMRTLAWDVLTLLLMRRFHVCILSLRDIHAFGFVRSHVHLCYAQGNAIFFDFCFRGLACTTSNIIPSS